MCTQKIVNTEDCCTDTNLLQHYVAVGDIHAFFREIAEIHVAPLVEHQYGNPEVAGSSPTLVKFFAHSKNIHVCNKQIVTR